ncbi:MAG: hypothetical protein M1412_01745 [Deltaproteobacteria bacterium]|nr:hypothetical protein [Deltaproteobacteria bacterium]MCL5891878.1 hypothetical protein [Deltaproteobacteria bacterium]
MKERKEKIKALIFNAQVYLIGLISSLAVILKPIVASAQLTNGNSAAIGSSFTAAENWIKLVFGPGMFLMGLAGVAVAHFIGNEKAHVWAVRVLIGGLIILLGEALWALISSWTGA